MKRIGLIVAAVAAVVALAYTGGAWYLGKEVEAALGSAYQSLDSPWLKVVNRSYQRGIFGATETVTVELFADKRKMTGSLPGKNPQSLRLTFSSKVTHGPLPGLQVGAARIDSELVNEGEQAELFRLTGGKQPLKIRTVYRLGGGGSSVITSPDFTSTLPGKEEGQSETLVWDGLEVKLEVDKQWKRYVASAQAPKLEIKNSKGLNIALTGFRFDTDQKRIFDDDDSLYSGSMKVALAQMSVAGLKADSEPFVIKQIAYDINSANKGDYLDIAAKIGAQALLLGPRNYGPAHYDFSFNHLHARSVAKMMRTWKKIAADPALQSAAGGNPGQAFASLVEPLLEVLKHSPEINVDRLSFTSKHGEAQLSAFAKLDDLRQEDLSNQMMFFAKLNVNADLQLPEAFVTELAGDPAAGEDAAARAAALQQRIAELAEQGYIYRESGAIKTRIQFTYGQLAVNGRAFDPSALDGIKRVLMPSPTQAPAPVMLDERDPGGSPARGEPAMRPSGTKAP